MTKTKVHYCRDYVEVHGEVFCGCRFFYECVHCGRPLNNAHLETSRGRKCLFAAGGYTRPDSDGYTVVSAYDE